MIDGGMWTCVALIKLLCLLFIFESCVGVILAVPVKILFSLRKSGRKQRKNPVKNASSPFSRLPVPLMRFQRAQVSIQRMLQGIRHLR